jgi:hypothetical protein
MVAFEEGTSARGWAKFWANFRLASAILRSLGGGVSGSFLVRVVR